MLLSSYDDMESRSRHRKIAQATNVAASCSKNGVIESSGIVSADSR
jgi:hypothetical protein